MRVTKIVVFRTKEAWPKIEVYVTYTFLGIPVRHRKYLSQKIKTKNRVFTDEYGNLVGSKLTTKLTVAFDAYLAERGKLTNIRK
jgi:hypothetical protein